MMHISVGMHIYVCGNIRTHIILDIWEEKNKEPQPHWPLPAIQEKQSSSTGVWG